MNVATLVDKFVKWCENHRSASTARQYRSRLRTFRDRFANTDVADLMPLDIQEWLDQAGQGKAPDTRRAMIVVVERLQQWAVKMKLLAEPILTKIEKPRGRRRETLPTAKEIDTILATGSREFGLMFRALLACGARPNELCRATVADVHTESVETESGETVEVQSIVLEEHKTAEKTGRPRVIPIGKDFRAIIDESLGDRTEGNLFLTPTGKPWTVSGLGAAFRRIRKNAGLRKELVIYLARHKHGTVMCEKYGIQAAADALGHSSVETTSDRYVKKSIRLQRDRQSGLYDDDERKAA